MQEPAHVGVERVHHVVEGGGERPLVLARPFHHVDGGEAPGDAHSHEIDAAHRVAVDGDDGPLEREGGARAYRRTRGGVPTEDERREEPLVEALARGGGVKASHGP